jgi:sorting nexin-25
VGHEPGADFVLYNIVIRQFQSDDSLVSSWTVSRRYSEFYELHRSLRRQFADVKHIAFPKKSNPIGAVLKPTRGGFVEGRMASLEKYIQVDLAKSSIDSRRYFLFQE